VPSRLVRRPRGLRPTARPRRPNAAGGLRQLARSRRLTCRNGGLQISRSRPGCDRPDHQPRLDRVVPLGLSHAGWVALELRRQLGPDRVPAVVLLDWMPIGPPPGFADALLGLQDTQAWSTVRDQLFALWTDGVDDGVVHQYVQSMGAYGYEMWSRAGRKIARSFAATPVPLAAFAELADQGTRARRCTYTPSRETTATSPPSTRTPPPTRGSRCAGWEPAATSRAWKYRMRSRPGWASSSRACNDRSTRTPAGHRRPSRRRDLWHGIDHRGRGRTRCRGDCVLRDTRGGGEAHGLAADADLAAARETELCAAGSVLGVGRFILPDYVDSGMAGDAAPGTLATAPFDELVGALGSVVDQVAPDVVVTLDPDHGDGHRDHSVIAERRSRPAGIGARSGSMRTRCRGRCWRTGSPNSSRCARTAPISTWTVRVSAAPTTRSRRSSTWRTSSRSGNARSPCTGARWPRSTACPPNSGPRSCAPIG